MKRQDAIEAFNAGMHQLDIQDIDGEFYYVYDGNQLNSKKTKLNIIGALKMNFLDVKQWFNNL